jgi:hypothetical protein
LEIYDIVFGQGRLNGGEVECVVWDVVEGEKRGQFGRNRARIIDYDDIFQGRNDR